MTRSVPWDDENVNQLNNIIENWRDGYVPEPEAEPEPEIESQELTGLVHNKDDLRESIKTLVITGDREI